MKYYLFSAVVLSFSLIACGNQDKKKTEEQDENITMKKEITPEVILENEYSKVVKVTLAPGETLAAHSGEKRVIYSLSDYTIDWMEGEENEGSKSWKKGDVHFHEAGIHSAKNIGNSNAEWLAFVNKGNELPDCADNTIEKDVNSVAPDYAKLSFDNSTFRITEVTIPKLGKLPMHSGINRIIYSLTDYQIKYESEKEGSELKTFSDGDVHWHDACKHASENVGDSEAKFLVVGYK